jgi:hypothetical protein
MHVNTTAVRVPRSSRSTRANPRRRQEGQDTRCIPKQALENVCGLGWREPGVILPYSGNDGVNRAPRLMPAFLPNLPRVVATTATGEVEHPLRVFGALRVPLHDRVPLAAMWAEHQRADLELLGCGP